MSTPIDNYSIRDCEKIDANFVNAYFEFEIDPEDPNILILHNSWGDIKIDLSPIVKLNETVTHLKLSPADKPTTLDYENETGAHECIDGEVLSDIIRLKKLGDMSEDNDWRTGYAPVWDETAGKFIARYVSTEGSMDSRVTALEDAMVVVKDSLTNLHNTVMTFKNRIEALEEITKKPIGSPEDAQITWSNANIYTKNNKSTGAFVHDPASAVDGDRTINNDIT